MAQIAGDDPDRGRRQRSATPLKARSRRARLARALAAVALAALPLIGGSFALPGPALADGTGAGGSFASAPLALGDQHTCALPGDGTVVCWGDNTFGQLGNGRVTDPQAPAGDVELIQVVAADAAGAAPGYCIDLVPDESVIECHTARSLTGVTAITAGGSHVCALLVDTTVRCWGSNAPLDGGGFARSYRGGELGDGTTTVRSVPTPVVAAAGRTDPLTGVASISAATGYTCAVLQDHTATCWGDAPQTATVAPLAVLAADGQPLAGIASISAGDINACALMLDGGVECWGGGSLGNEAEPLGAEANHWPVRVVSTAAPPSPLGGVVGLALAHGVVQGPNGFGEGHSCALVAGGQVACWGVGDVSQLGNGSNQDSGIDPTVNHATTVIATVGSSAPLTGVHAIAAGGYFTCALINDGSVQCWGLGLGGSDFAGAGVPVPIEGSAVAIAAGGGRICEVRPDRSLWCSSGVDYGLEVVPGVKVAPPVPPAPTSAPPSAGSSPAPPAGTPGTGPGAPGGGAEGVVGTWEAGYGTAEGGQVSITYANGTYTITNLTPRVVMATCSIPVGQVMGAFAGSGGAYTGQDVTWLANCSTASVPTTLVWQGDTLAIHILASGVSTLHRVATVGAFRGSIPLPWELNLSPVVLLEAAVVAGGIVILFPFPGTLFNSTLEANYDKITGAARRVRRRLLGLLGRPGTVAPFEPAPATNAAPETRRDVWRTIPGVALFIGLTAVLAGFLDPSFGLNAGSVATFVGMVIGLTVVLAAFDLPLARYYRRHRIGFWLRALPATALVSVACVLVSRLTSFYPGYLYGLIVATVVATEVDHATEGRLMASATLTTIAVAIAAWLGLAVVTPLARASADPGVLVIVAQTALTMVVAAGVELAAFGMLPLRFLAGDSVKRWNRAAWAGLLAFGWLAFLIVILNPQNGYLSDSTRTPLVTIVALLALFAVISVLFWLYFQRRAATEGSEAGPESPPA